MPVHSNSSLDAAFSTTHGAAYSATVNESGVDNYTAPCIPKFNVDIVDEDVGIHDRSTTLEFRKADLNDSSAGLAKGTQVTLDSRLFYVEQLIEETTYTLRYTATE